jgi:hypothetical protein
MMHFMDKLWKRVSASTVPDARIDEVEAALRRAHLIEVAPTECLRSERFNSPFLQRIICDKWAKTDLKRAFAVVSDTLVELKLHLTAVLAFVQEASEQTKAYTQWRPGDWTDAKTAELTLKLQKLTHLQQQLNNTLLQLLNGKTDEPELSPLYLALTLFFSKTMFHMRSL